MIPDPSSRLCELQTSRGKVLLNYRLKRHARSRSLKVSVRDTGEVVLCVPTRTTDSTAMEFLRSQADWIVQALSRAPRPVNLMEHLRRQPWISACGRRLRVELTGGRSKHHWVADVDEGLVVIRYPESNDSGRSLTRVLAEIAANLLPPHVQDLARRVGVAVERVSVRNQRTLWGSCSSRGTLSLNWRLLMLPPDLQDHIIYHELAHLTHMDHSADFYHLLQTYDPRSTAHDHQVSKLSHQLMTLGR